MLLLGATPERAEFEASIDQDSEPPSIMDEDEWTDRNFGGNSLIIINDDFGAFLGHFQGTFGALTH